MNTRTITVKALNQLQFHTGLVAQVSQTDASVGGALIQFDNSNARLLAELREWATSGGTRNLIQELSQETRSGYDKLLICDYISDEEGARLRAANVNYLDNVGNAYLDIPPIYVLIQGKKPKERFDADRGSKLFTETGLKVILALLADGNLLNASYRSIADHASVSMGTIGWVLRELKNQGFIRSHGNQYRWLDRELLLRKWVDAFPDLKQKHLLGSYYCRHADWWKSIDLGRYEAVLGGELALAGAFPGFQPASGEIYVGRFKRDKLVRELKLSDVASAKSAQCVRVDVYSRFWGQMSDTNLFSQYAHPLINYASLMETWDPDVRKLATELVSDYLT
ncbi:type IV toxin-antitoxin system AbiEi family antitoxin [Arenicella chitinivorans]|nr:type IV toxin-antitoxin system AbiEi family antitoxin [Arenicella chitinivorans]